MTSPTTVTPASYPGSSPYQEAYADQAVFAAPSTSPQNAYGAPSPYQSFPTPVGATSTPYNCAPQPLQPAYSSNRTPTSAEKSQLEQRYVELSRQHATELNEAELKHKVAQLEAKVRIKRAMVLLQEVEKEMSFLEEKFDTTRLATEATAIKQPLAQIKNQLTAMSDLPEQVKQFNPPATLPVDSDSSWAPTPATATPPGFQPYTREPSATSYPQPNTFSQPLPPPTGFDSAPLNALPTPVTPQPQTPPYTSNPFPPATSSAPTPIHVGRTFRASNNTNRFPVTESTLVPATKSRKTASVRAGTITGRVIIEEEPELDLSSDFSQPLKKDSIRVPAKSSRKPSAGRVLIVTPGANLIGEEEEPLLGLEARPETKPTKEAKPVTTAETTRETTSIITVTPRIIIQEEENENLSLSSE
ncbi:MAG: hypothetical protein ACKVH8_05375 [Pirellulales bacterium]